MTATRRLSLVRETRDLWDPYDDTPYGTEDVYVVRDGDDTYEFATVTAAHAALDFLDEARGRDRWPCSWTVELTGARRPPEPDSRSDLYGPCNAPAVASADGRGWACLAGHEHRTDAEYFGADEVAHALRAGHVLPANARLMDGTPIGDV